MAERGLRSKSARAAHIAVKRGIRTRFDRRQLRRSESQYSSPSKDGRSEKSPERDHKTASARCNDVVNDSVDDAESPSTLSDDSTSIRDLFNSEADGSNCPPEGQVDPRFSGPLHVSIEYQSQLDEKTNPIGIQTEDVNNRITMETACNPFEGADVHSSSLTEDPNSITEAKNKKGAKCESIHKTNMEIITGAHAPRQYLESKKAAHRRQLKPTQSMTVPIFYAPIKAQAKEAISPVESDKLSSQSLASPKSSCTAASLFESETRSSKRTRVLESIHSSLPSVLLRKSSYLPTDGEVATHIEAIEVAKDGSASVTAGEAIRNERISSSIFIWNISSSVEEEQLIELMPHMPCTFKLQPDQGQVGTTASAQFISPEDAMTVVGYLNHYELQGQKLWVDFQMSSYQEQENIEREEWQRRSRSQIMEDRPLGTEVYLDPSGRGQSGYRCSQFSDHGIPKELGRVWEENRDPAFENFNPLQSAPSFSSSLNTDGIFDTPGLRSSSKAEPTSMYDTDEELEKRASGGKLKVEKETATKELIRWQQKVVRFRQEIIQHMRQEKERIDTWLFHVDPRELAPDRTQKAQIVAAYPGIMDRRQCNSQKSEVTKQSEDLRKVEEALSSPKFLPKADLEPLKPCEILKREVKAALERYESARDIELQQDNEEPEIVSRLREITVAIDPEMIAYVILAKQRLWLKTATHLEADVREARWIIEHSGRSSEEAAWKGGARLIKSALQHMAKLVDLASEICWQVMGNMPKFQGAFIKQQVATLSRLVKQADDAQSDMADQRLDSKSRPTTLPRDIDESERNQLDEEGRVYDSYRRQLQQLSMELNLALAAREWHAPPSHLF